jgi:hypothetical protein
MDVIISVTELWELLSVIVGLMTQIGVDHRVKHNKIVCNCFTLMGLKVLYFYFMIMSYYQV